MEMNELSIALAERGIRLARIDVDRCLDLALTIYTDTPLIPGSPYRVHDSERPQPPIVQPGTPSTPDRPGAPPSDAVVLFDGKGLVRHKDGTIPIETGDAFIFGPGQPHQLINDSSQDLILYVVADNPIDESTYYPDSKKWLVLSPERRLFRGEALEFYDGEE